MEKYLVNIAICRISLSFLLELSHHETFGSCHLIIHVRNPTVTYPGRAYSDLPGPCLQ